MTSRYRSVPYDVTKFGFVAPVARLFDGVDLSELNEKHSELFKVGSDSSTSFHQKFYDRYRAGWPELTELYERFISEVVAPIMAAPFLYQKFPTFRVHLPGNLAVGAFHTDAEFGHPTGERNFVIPLTNSGGTASIWVESTPGWNDFTPMILQVGQLIEFNGNKLRHGNKINITGQTRVSMDFRTILAADYKEGAESMTLKTKIKEGTYYRKFEYGQAKSPRN